MLSAKILGVVFSLLLVYSMPTERKHSENEAGFPSYTKEESDVFYKFGAESNTRREYDGKPSTSSRYARSPSRMSSGQTETSKSYEFDYLIHSPNYDLQFRSEKGFPNGTVVGFYGYYESGVRYLVVNYIADANGYRPTIQKDESGQGRFVVLTAKRGPGGITYALKTLLYQSTYAVSGKNLFGNDTKDAVENNDEYPT
ncbi:hypothetical protein AVEN_93905-1 [Araneus ventricosus]|uniref:Uncharacterized protein n=1 Tax=Araneus ventricosus TaxID=182803 RepID=A0A4Y2UVZ2_ARAVE|nr:hypothetical protein AVEN_38611-1 [Araneus ventricosus]GBO17185.1 hypothetical protein AVEN_93905-1 [Araneus ventricosus]